MREMNDLFLLEPEYHYRVERTRQQLKAVRRRRWLRRLAAERAAGNERNWIS
jgi:hypothetical protein